MSDPLFEDRIFGEGPAPSRQDMRRNRRERRSRGRARRWITVLVALAVVGGAGYFGYGLLRPVYDQMTASNDYPGPGTGEVQVVVEEGDLGRQIGKTLQTAGVVKTQDAFLEAVAADEKAAKSIQPGRYTLKKEMAAADALAALVDPANRYVGPKVTIREGLWASEIFPLLSKATGIPVADYEKAAKDAKAIGLPAAAKGNVEGYLFPATYTFREGSTATQQLAEMVKMATAELTKAGVAPEKMERVMIVASIIEGEVNADTDRAKVARVIENRLATTGPPVHGLLQMDSTVHYAVQERGRAGTSDAQRQSKSPYNTYLVKGLPPGPINSPGAASIAAAAQPAEGDWLFFVTVNPETGETKFAETLDEHEKNAAEFRAWCSANPGKC